MDLKEKIKSLPLSSGVYFMKNKKGDILYVGKAINLRKRVQSYFRASSDTIKTGMLKTEAFDVDYIPTQSEAEALILEASLIKKHKPKYNIDLRDDKSYPFIEITKEEFPCVRVVRPRIKKKTSRYFGPYVNVQLVREALKIIRKIFPFRTCKKLPQKPCLDHHIGLCAAPCVDKIGKKQYAKIIKNVRLILEGKKDTLYNGLRKDMESLSKAKKFEEAAMVRDQMRALGALYSSTKDINYYKEAEQLQRVLNLAKKPEHIEAFDISNIMGNEAVGAMVSFLNGKPDKNNYRRFKIREIKGIDDFKMISEVVKRRYRRLKNEGRLFPDLIIIDGGKGQLSSACSSLEDLDVSIPIISIAKRFEEVFVPNKRDPVILNKNSLGLKLIQRIRDEAHRFAISYHRKLRKKKTLYDEA